ncbi:MAG: hypothetical protein U9N52_06725 [Campylobacterota bacterium]|nr:hypothetical protein [Campylobacterota bacterium]
MSISLDNQVLGRFIPVAFEVDDGIEKLLELGIVTEKQGVLHVSPIDEANRCLSKALVSAI